MKYPDKKPASDRERTPHSDVIATPEGDSEFAPDQPITPHPAAPDIPRGNEPHPSQPIRPAE